MNQQELDALWNKPHVQDLVRATTLDDEDEEGPTHERVEKLFKAWKRKQWLITLANEETFIGTFDEMDNNPAMWYYEALNHHEALAPFSIIVDVKQAQRLLPFPVHRASIAMFDVNELGVEIFIDELEFRISGHIASFSEHSKIRKL